MPTTKGDNPKQKGSGAVISTPGSVRAANARRQQALAAEFREITNRARADMEAALAAYHLAINDTPPHAPTRTRQSPDPPTRTRQSPDPPTRTRQPLHANPPHRTRQPLHANPPHRTRQPPDQHKVTFKEEQKQLFDKISDKNMFECPVCLENYGENSELHMQKDCGHILCITCYTQLKNTDTGNMCPVCRKPLSGGKHKRKQTKQVV